MSKRRFEFIEGRSYKFWEVAVTDARVTVTFGRIGTEGQTQVKTFHSADEAKRYALKLITAKTNKGYAEIPAAPAVSAVG
jgi:predicted DNA-binding WGR domain protein